MAISIYYAEGNKACSKKAHRYSKTNNKDTGGGEHRSGRGEINKNRDAGAVSLARARGLQKFSSPQSQLANIVLVKTKKNALEQGVNHIK